MTAAEVVIAHHAEYDDRTYHLVCACGAKWPALREDYDVEIALHAEHVADELGAAGLGVIKIDEYNRTIAAMSDWQRSALTVIIAANRFVLDCVTGDGDPRTVAAALVESGFDGRVEP